MAPTIPPDPVSQGISVWSLLRGVLLSATAGKVRLCLDPSELPFALPDAGPLYTLGPDTLAAFRRAVYEFAVRQGVPSERRQLLLTAAGEAAMNAIQHGGGGEANLSVGPHRTLQIWIRDRGARTEDRAAESDANCTGYGWWLIIGAIDRAWICPDPTGTVVVLEQECTDSEAGLLGGEATIAPARQTM